MEKNSQDLFNGLILSGVQDLLNITKVHNKTLVSLAKANRKTNMLLGWTMVVVGITGLDSLSRQKRMEKELEELKRAKGE